MFVSSRPALSPRLLFQSPSTCELPFPFAAARKVYACSARGLLYHAVEKLLDRRRIVLAPEGLDGTAATALRRAGADLRFYPVDRRVRVELDALDRLATSDVRAVIVVHALGWPEGQVEAIARLASARDLVLIEDCSASMFAEHRGRPVGSFGDLALFALGRALPVPSGALLVEHGTEASLVDALAPETPEPCPIDGLTARTVGLVLDALELDVEWLGRGLRLVRTGVERAVERLVAEGAFDRVSDDDSLRLCALAPLTRHILERIDYDRIAERRRILHALLHQRLADRVAALDRDGFDGAAPEGYSIVVGDLDLAIAELRARGVAALPAWQTAELAAAGELAWLAAHVVSLPLHQDLTLEHVEHVAWAVADAARALAPPRGPRRARAERAAALAPWSAVAAGR